MPQPDQYRIDVHATIAATADDLVVVSRRAITEAIQRAAEDAWRSATKQLSGAYFEMAYESLREQGLIVTHAEREQLEQQAVERTMRAIADQSGIVQQVAIVSLPPMNAEVIRDERGRIAGVVDG